MNAARRLFAIGNRRNRRGRWLLSIQYQTPRSDRELTLIRLGRNDQTFCNDLVRSSLSTLFRPSGYPRFAPAVAELPDFARPQIRNVLRILVSATQACCGKFNSYTAFHGPDSWIKSMPGAPIPKFEDERLSALARYQILDTEAEEVFDRITLMAKSIFGTPIALVSLIDSNRQWFKSHSGLDARETPRDQAFCGYAILQSDILVVEDATKDPRFADNPLVISAPNIRFYAGAQLVTHDGHALGTLCIIDKTPRQFLDTDKRLLIELAGIVMNEIELRVLKATAQSQQKFVSRDPQTNAFNNKTFRKLFNAECERARGRSIPLSLAVIHLEQLDSVYRTLGTAACDVAVSSLRDVFKSIVRSADIVARVDTFVLVLLMPNTKSSSAEIVVRRILNRVATCEPEIDGTKIRYSVSVGVAQLSCSQKATDFYKEAEKNRCTASEMGHNRYVASYAA